MGGKGECECEWEITVGERSQAGAETSELKILVIWEMKYVKDTRAFYYTHTHVSSNKPLRIICVHWINT